MANVRTRRAGAGAGQGTGVIKPWTGKMPKSDAGYTDRTLQVNTRCVRCQRFRPGMQDVPNATNIWGTCKLVRGKIHPLGTCAIFQPRSFERLRK